MKAQRQAPNTHAQTHQPRSYSRPGSIGIGAPAMLEKNPNVSPIEHHLARYYQKKYSNIR